MGLLINELINVASLMPPTPVRQTKIVTADEKRLCLKCQVVTGLSERRRCCECDQMKNYQAFGDSWNAEEATRLCRHCSAQCYCKDCKQVRPRMAFCENQVKQKRSDRKCEGCAGLVDNKNRHNGDVYACNLVGGCQRVLAVNF